MTDPTTAMRRLAIALDAAASAAFELAGEAHTSAVEGAEGLSPLALQPLPPVRSAEPAPQAPTPPVAAPRAADAVDHVPGQTCPAHGAVYRPGNYGLFCPAKGTDPAWTNGRGYCTITPDKEANFLRIQAAANGR